PTASGPLWTTRPSNRSPRSQVESSERYTASAQLPVAVTPAALVTVKLTLSVSPEIAPLAARIESTSTCRSEGGGSSISSGSSDGVVLLSSCAPSNTAARGERRSVTTSVQTKA